MESLVTQNVMHTSLCHMISAGNRCVGEGGGTEGTGGQVGGEVGGLRGQEDRWGD